MKEHLNRRVIVNTIGNYFNVFFSGFLILVLVRVFTKAEMGVFSVLYGIIFVITNVLDFGTTANIYSNLPSLTTLKSKELYHFLKSIFSYQTIFSFIAVVIFINIFPFLDKIFFKTNSSIFFIYISGLAILFLVWQNFLLNCLFATKQVVSTNVYMGISNVMRLIILVFFVQLHFINVGIVIFIFAVLGPLMFISFVLLKKRKIIWTILSAKMFRKYIRFRYTFTFFAAIQMFNLGLQMDLFMLSYFLPKSEVGLYGLSQKIIFTIITSVNSINQVISPDFSSILSRSKLIVVLKYALTYLSLPTFSFLALHFVPDFIFLIFTREFVESAPIARSLALPYILYPISTVPLLFLLYTVKKPYIILFANLIFLLLVSAGSYFLIPMYGVFGPIFSLGAGFLVLIVLLGGFSILEYRRLK